MVGAVAYAVGFALLIAGRANFWGAEGFAAGMTQLRWGPLVRDLGHIDVNMSLYDLSTKLWVGVFGLSEAPPAHLQHAVRVRRAARDVPPGSAAPRPPAGRLAGDAGGREPVLPPGGPDRPYAMVMLASLMATIVLVRAREQPGLRWWVICPRHRRRHHHRRHPTDRHLPRSRRHPRLDRDTDNPRNRRHRRQGDRLPSAARRVHHRGADRSRHDPPPGTTR